MSEDNREKRVREAAYLKYAGKSGSSRKSSEEAENLGRRTFLKGALGLFLLAGAGYLAKTIRELAPSDTPEYFELDDGKKINLFKGDSNETVLLTMSYSSNKMSSLNVRLSGNVGNKEPLFVKFISGAGNRRRVGEIIEPRVYKLKIDTEKIGKGYNVGLYSNPEPHGSLDGRIYCPENDDLWGIPVITAPENLLFGLEEGPPFERNTGNVSEVWMNITKFGQGYLVGKMIDSRIEGEKTFKALGYVNDARVFKIVE
ncbi:hypothetical protein KJ570_00770 [Patescibacteria group bacterium]|nr:hypothetical protein [Patescibacteria group bacterium]